MNAISSGERVAFLPLRVAICVNIGSVGGAKLNAARVLSWLQISHAQQAVKKEALDPGTVQMLSNILESLDAFRNDRLRDLEKIRFATPPGNGTTVTRIGDITDTPTNSSVSEHIKALKEGIMGHNPVKKTFGYKVTVYTSPIGEDGKGKD
ncbi:hypothetical protein AVEN_221418-1 [Araneus ventricosus]|uniref:Uncharacterized protein n=1 Tax=Araneus ventricosus TaxID=182803 RepID=A0A4Y2PNZ4_ARAVE|nr:hypothetical protein AVEN_221418-1 [Araneus ventricosus]